MLAASFNLWLLPAALLLEAALGYPDALYRAIRHPVVWIGALIARLDRTFNRAHHGFAARRAWGVAALAILLIVVGGAAWAIATLCAQFRHGWLIEALLAATLLAQRSLSDHVRAVAAGLETEGLAGGRLAVSMIVGRDPESLDEAGVSRAAIESLAENFSDGVVAPAFWLLLGGLPGIALYKAINTADSMIGHKSERHLAFGWAAARLDDLVNLPASRLSGLLITSASGKAAMASLRTMLRDAAKHRSPNAGWPEAAIAGALGLRLAGPRQYREGLVQDHWMGDGRAEATATDIRRALALYWRACGLLAALALLLAVTLR